MVIFIIPQALAQNFATLIVVRIITGSCAGSLANVASGMAKFRSIIRAQLTMLIQVL
jgi:predicted MFS family arabinose efflux permease